MSTGKITLTAYFSAVERRLLSVVSEFNDLSVSISGKKLLMHFQTKEQADEARLSLTGLVSDPLDTDPPAAEFFHWEDSLETYLPERAAEQKGVWTSRDDTGYLNIVTEYGLLGADYSRSRYYICLRESKASMDALNSHAMITSLFRWALQSDMFLLHSASVGVEGRGVLIGARGGRGKSSLSVACLLQGMDFVADDYVLLNQHGPLMARPLYRTVGLNPDMEAVMKTDLPVLKRDPNRGGKMLLDASRMKFCDALPIHGIIFPEIGKEREISIVPVAPGKAVTQMVYSSLSQFDVFRELSIVQMMLQRLKDLPVYEMYLSPDPKANALYLERFLKKNGFD